MMEMNDILILLKSENPEKRRTGAQALADYDDELAVKILVELLRDEDSGVKDAAFNSLIKIGNEHVVEQAVKILESGDIDLNAVIIEIITVVGENHIDKLMALLSSRDKEVVKTVLDILGNTSLSDNKDKICSGIIKYLNDEDPNIRFAVSEVMGKLPCWNCGDALVDRYKRENEEWVKYAILESIKSIKGENYTIDDKTIMEIMEEI